jgi:proline dehydrogenase
MRNAAKDAMDSLMNGGSPLADKAEQDVIEQEVNELRDKICELFAGKKAYSCILAAGQALTMGTCMLADVDIKTEDGQKQAKGITEKVQKFIGQTVAEALVGSKTPDALMNFVKDSLSKLKSKDTIKDIIQDMGPPEENN